MGKLPSRLGPWHEHVMKVKSQNPGKQFKDVLKIAKKTYRKHAKSLSKSLSKHAKSLSGVEINTNSYNIKVKSRKGKKLSKKATRKAPRKATRKASRKKTRRRKKRSFGFF